MPMKNDVFEFDMPAPTPPGKERKLRFHKTNGVITPNNRREMMDKIQYRASQLREWGYPEDAAQYLAESEILPKYFITPATDLKQEQFKTTLQEFALQTLAEQKNLARALQVLEPYGVTRRVWNEWIEKSAGFKDALDHVVADIGDYYEGLAQERVANPVPGVGGDRLLVRMMEAYKPERFTPVQKQEHSGVGGGPILHSIEGSKARLKAKLAVIVLRAEHSAGVEIPKSRRQQLEAVQEAEVLDVTPATGTG